MTLILEPISGVTKREDFIVISRSPFCVGRHPSNDYCLSKADVSGVHARFSETEAGWTLKDGPSTNGTFLNGKHVRNEAVPVSIGDVICFATTGFRVVPKTEVDRIDRRTMQVSASGEVQEKLELINIVNDNRTYPYFQPIVRLESNKVLGWEALGRAFRASGPIDIKQLFKVAGHSGLQPQLSQRFRQSAIGCLECNHCWPDGKYHLFINTYPSDVLQREFLSTLNELARSEVGRHYQMVIEIPETLVMKVDQMQALVDTIRNCGMLVAYDDFGQGNSRLPDLINVPPDFLKVDRELISQLGEHSAKRNLVQGVVETCRDLNVRTIAEGIETTSELSDCMDLGFEFAQGRILGEPMPAYRMFNVERKTLPNICPFVQIDSQMLTAPPMRQ